MGSIDVSALPDKGERLKNQVQELEDALEALSLTNTFPTGTSFYLLAEVMGCV